MSDHYLEPFCVARIAALNPQWKLRTLVCGPRGNAGAGSGSGTGEGALTTAAFA
jgi:hypothetical protein